MDGCSGIFNATRFRGLSGQLSSVQESGKSFCQLGFEGGGEKFRAPWKRENALWQRAIGATAEKFELV